MNNKTSQAKWDNRFLSFALMYSTISKDPSTKIGCLIVDSLNRPVGWGTNGFSRHSSDSENFFNNREEKYKRVLHAEENALYNAMQSVVGCTAYLTHPPCLNCCHRLSQNGITRVVAIHPNEDFSKRWNMAETKDELGDLGIQFEVISEPNSDTIIEALDQFQKVTIG